MNSFRRSFYVGIFLTAASTLLLEISLTKMFSVIHFHYFAFLIVSTALFGYGLSGVTLFVSKRIENVPRNKLLYYAAILFAITTVLSFRLILAIPLRISALLVGYHQLLYLALVYLLLACPFFFSGIVIGVLLSKYTENVSRLYFADLLGAGIGSFSIVLIIPFVGGSGCLLVACILAALAAVAFADTGSRRLGAVAIVLIAAALLPVAERLFPTALLSEKRYFKDSLDKGQLLFTGWSPASRIDVVTQSNKYNVIWIDGGTNQSFMKKITKEVVPVAVDDIENIDRTIEIPYALVKEPRALIIGPGGGVEVASALKYSPKSITGVELDPLITQIVLGKFATDIGHIYTKPGVKLYNEEGRSFIRRSEEKFDIIQQKNNAHPMAVSSGALNLTETYLLTKEAFNEYLDHLNPNGFITIQRYGGIRLLNLGIEVLRDRGVQDYWNWMVLIGDEDTRQFFIMKNGALTSQEREYIWKYAREMRQQILYHPDMMVDGPERDYLYTDLMNEQKRQQILRDAPFNISAPTDDRPFMEHFYRIEAFFSEPMRELQHNHYWRKAHLFKFTEGEGTYSDLSLYLILVEAVLLSSLFIIFPLLRFRRISAGTRGVWRLIIYFASLGVAFIFMEIVFIQKYILFIGYPVYAVAAIIFALLVSAALGSLSTGWLRGSTMRKLGIAVLAICLTTVAQVTLVPLLFRHFLSAPFAARVALSILFLFPGGYFMGMPFPLGLTWVSKSSPKFLPWAWGINGYATVIGSVLSVILALHFGFRFVLLLSCAVYVIGYLSLRTAPAQTPP